MAGGSEPWRSLDRRNVMDFGVFQVLEVDREGPHGKVGTFSILQSPDWCVVVPVVAREGRRFLLAVRQFRQGSGKVSVEFPGGVVERGEDPDAAAMRELREETGYGAREIALLGDISPNPALQTNRFRVYLAEGLHPAGGQSLDEHEIIDVEEVPEEELLERLGTPPYDHALMVAAAFLYIRRRGIPKS